MNTPAARLQDVLDHISRSVRASGRAAQPTLVAVSKTRSEAAIEALINEGQREFGESRVQEAQDKWPALKANHPDLTLHMIGRLQSNKAEDAVRLFDVIHSLDRASLLDALVAAGEKTGRWPEVFVQVNVGDEEQKGGVSVADLSAFVAKVRATPLKLVGLMAIPPAGVQPSPYFALLAKLAGENGLTGLSMGMSADYPTATLLGATHLRVGSALFEG